MTGLEPATSGVTGRHSNQLSYTRVQVETFELFRKLMGRAVAPLHLFLERVARVTGLEPATSGVTGRHSNQLSYTRVSRPKRLCAPARGVV